MLTRVISVVLCILLSRLHNPADERAHATGGGGAECDTAKRCIFVCIVHFT